MAVLIDEATLRNQIREIRNGEPVDSNLLNRPTLDLVTALAGTNGVFQSVEDLISFETINKPTHVVNDTKLLVHFDDTLDSVVEGQFPTTIPSNIGVNILESKFFGAYDLNLSNVASPENNFIEYKSLSNNQTAAYQPTQGSISFWVKPYSIGTSSVQANHYVWDWSSGAFPSGDDYPLVSMYIQESGGVSVVQNKDARGVIGPATNSNYIEIGFNSLQKYFYARFVGDGGAGNPGKDYKLVQPDGSYPDFTAFSDKWYNLAVTWHLDDTTGATPADYIYELNFYVNGDLVATNLPFGDVSGNRFEDIINFIPIPPTGQEARAQIHTGSWYIDELRYDERLVTDEEIFSWYQSNVPFVHKINTLTPREFGQVNVNQMMKAILSGAASGDFTKNYYYVPNGTTHSEQSSTDLSGFLESVEFTKTTGKPEWKAESSFLYDKEGNLTSTTFTIHPNGNGTSTILVTELHRYDTDVYAVASVGAENGITTSTIVHPSTDRYATVGHPGPDPVYNSGSSPTRGYLQDSKIITDVL